MRISLKKYFAVTLVELLTVLTILGVLAALTLPGLKKHSQRTEYAKLAQVGYVALETALDKAYDSSGLSLADWLNESPSMILDTYFKQSLSYTSVSQMPNYKAFKSKDTVNANADGLILYNGIMIAASNADGQNSSFFIDVNSTSLPNMEGVDIFGFSYGVFDANCQAVQNNAAGTLKLCPLGHAENLINDGWRITYW